MRINALDMYVIANLAVLYKIDIGSIVHTYVR